MVFAVSSYSDKIHIKLLPVNGKYSKEKYSQEWLTYFYEIVTYGVKEIPREMTTDEVAALGFCEDAMDATKAAKHVASATDCHSSTSAHS